MRIAVTGSSGLIGGALVRDRRERGDSVLQLVRRPPKEVNEIFWDSEAPHVNLDAIEGLDVIANFSGEPIMGRWTRDKKNRIYQSRVEGTRFLKGNLLQLRCPPKVFLSASAVGYYGNRDDELLDETQPRGMGFLAQTVQEWEAAALGKSPHITRVAVLRIGMVLTPGGGALSKMLPIFKLGLGGRLGNGCQWLSWISLEDLIRAIDFIISKELHGIINVVSPYPSRNRDLTDAISRALERPAIIPVPKTILRMIFGELADEVLLASARVIPRRLLEVGFHFEYPTIEEAIRSSL